MRNQTPETPSGSALDRLSPELERLLRVGARRRQLSKNEVLYTRGSAPDSVFCVESGAVQLSATSVNGREAVLGVAEQGRWFGELTLFINAPRVHDAKALVKTELLVVPARRLHEVVDHNADYLREFLRVVCYRYKWAIERIDASILQPLAVRLAQRLLAEREMVMREGESQQPELRLSQEGLAQRLGASRQSVNRQLKEWESKGLLRVVYGGVTLLDTEALRRVS
ncbi:MAG TPA: Crp/Fnr family transcriptional regulator [Comamonadaceae bacterium]|nr:Crp/Fnr family transcriptional regulator [Comamonadaceae bacterium]